MKNENVETNQYTEDEINRFIIICIEQYASFKDISGKETYRLMSEKKVIDELKNDYEDLHGMSWEWLNDYIDSLLNK